VEEKGHREEEKRKRKRIGTYGIKKKGKLKE